MSTKDLLTALDAAQPAIAHRAMYLAGKQPLRFMRGQVTKPARFSSNLSRVAITAVAERLRIQDVKVTVKGADKTETANQVLEDADFKMTLQSVIFEALGLGSAYLIVWADEYDGRPTITVESAEQVAVLRHPVNRSVTSAVKRWDVVDANGLVTETHVMKYERTRITHLKRDAARGKLRFVEGWDNPLGVVPVVPLTNMERVHDVQGHSVIDDLAPLVDALNKLFSDMLTTSDAVARPKRYATGVALEDDDEGGFIADTDAGFSADDVDQDGEVADVDEFADDGVHSPFRDSDDMWIAEQAEAKFGQLAGADMTGYQTAVDLVMQQIMAVTALPGHMVGITTANPATAEALRASEVALDSRASSRIAVLDAPVEWAIRLLVAVAEGVSPHEVKASITWAKTSTESVAADADAAIKLHAEGVFDTDETRSRLGVSSPN